jgi:O-antigen ligase
MSASAGPVAIRATGAESAVTLDQPPLAWVDNILFLGLFLLLVFAIGAFGTVEPWSIFIFESGALVLFVIWAIKQVAQKHFALQWNPLYPAFAVLAGVVAIQLTLGLTAYRAATLEQSLRYLAYLFLIVVANDVFRRPALVKHFALLLSFFGLAVACVSLVQDASHSTKLLFLRAPHEAGWSYGPYENHSHYAGLMLMLAAFPLPLAMAPYLRGRTRALLGAAAAVMVATIFLSSSRGGVIAFFAQAAFLALVFARGRQHRRKVAIAACIGFISLAALFAFGRGSTLERLASLRGPLTNEIPGLRLAVVKDSHAMLHDRPVLGSGLGTFQDVYPQYRSFYTNAVVEHAHNDYLEFLLETGMVGFAGVLWFVIVLLRRGWQQVPQWKTGLTGTVKIGAMAGCIAMLVHSLMDYNLQITANAAMFFVLATMAAGRDVDTSEM